jgi:hypothetical protein
VLFRSGLLQRSQVLLREAPALALASRHRSAPGQTTQCSSGEASATSNARTARHAPLRRASPGLGCRSRRPPAAGAPQASSSCPVQVQGKVSTLPVGRPCHRPATWPRHPATPLASCTRPCFRPARVPASGCTRAGHVHKAGRRPATRLVQEIADTWCCMPPVAPRVPGRRQRLGASWRSGGFGAPAGGHQPETRAGTLHK